MTVDEAARAGITTMARPMWPKGMHLRIEIMASGRAAPRAHLFSPKFNEYTDVNSIPMTGFPENDFVEYEAPDEDQK